MSRRTERRTICGHLAPRENTARNNRMLLCFDYDGVIVDSFDSLLSVCVEAQAASGHGRAPSPADFRTIENLSFEELGRVIGIPDNKLASYCDTVFELQQKNWETDTFPGMVDVLSELATQHTLTVVTSSQGKVVAAALNAFGLGKAITAVTGGESGESKATRIARLRAAHATAGEVTFMIGDTVGDIRAGKEAGVRTAAVTWGYQQRDLLSKELPDCLLDQPTELLAIVCA
jgi:phosphoglycolate phosphatase